MLETDRGYPRVSALSTSLSIGAEATAAFHERVDETRTLQKTSGKLFTHNKAVEYVRDEPRA
jgi:hypothetical protein